jgi:hypothetical protein
MPIYVAHIIGRGDHYLDSIILDCVDDTSAVKLARQIGNGRDVELWKGPRKIASFKIGTLGETTAA